MISSGSNWIGKGLALVAALIAVMPSHIASQAATVPFPPRDQAFDFRANHLERKYRDGLRRQPVLTFVDVEGDIVWTQEYLRLRVNGQSHAAAVSAVRGEIDRVSGRPGLRDFESFTLFEFPPRNESFSFRLELESIYRDRLLRQPVSTYVDTEGSLVWTQQYLLHRVNGCAHLESVERVLDEIDTGRVAAPCVPIVPCSFEISAFSRPFPQAGATGEFTVSTQAGCSWYVERTISAEDFVSVGENLRIGTQSVTYTVRANTSGAARTGQLNIRESPTNRGLFSHMINQS